MPYSARRHFFPDPEDRHQHLQVVNIYVDGQTDLSPVSEAPAEAVREGMQPLLEGQALPLIGEQVDFDDNPDLRDLN